MAPMMAEVAFIAPGRSEAYERSARKLKARSLACSRFENHKQMLAARGKVRSGPPRVVVVDLSAVDPSPDTVIDVVRAVCGGTDAEVLVLGAEPTAEVMLKVMCAGAYEYRACSAVLEDISGFCLLIQRICAEPRVSDEDLKTVLQTEPGAFLGRSSPILEAVTQAAKVLSEDSVLFLGESGAGKSFLARAVLEARYPERAKKFVRVDCGALADQLMEAELFGWMGQSFTGAGRRRRKGLFELADGGVLFLDEIGNLALPHQQALLMALESNPKNPFLKTIRKIGHAEAKVNVQVVAATQYDLKRMVEKSEFLEALYYRISRYCVSVPPLRDRPEDILYIANRLLLGASDRMDKRFREIGAEAAECLKTYPWPGNVRELANVIAAAVRLNRGTVLEADQLPDYVRSGQAAPVGHAVYGEELVRLRTGLSRSELRRLAGEFPRGDLTAADGTDVPLADVGPADAENLERLRKRLHVSRTTLWKRRAQGRRR